MLKINKCINCGASINYKKVEEGVYQCPYCREHYHKNHVAEEIADVMVMLKQIQYYYGIEDEQIKIIMDYKIQRQLERIEKETKDV